MKKLLYLLIALLMLEALPFSAAAEVDIQTMVDELPTVEQFQAMDLEDQQKAYNHVQEVYDVYMTLSQEERLKISGAEEKFEALFSWFNMQVMPVTEPVVEEPGFRIPWIAILAAVVTTLVIAGFRKRK